MNSEELPWADWAYQFRQNMPPKLAEFVQDKAAANTEKDHLKTIKERLKGIIDLYKVSRYKPTPSGTYLSDDSTSIFSGLSSGSGNSSQGGGGTQGKNVGDKSKGARDGEVGNIYHLFEKPSGVPSENVQSDPFPNVTWVSVRDGTRDENDMEDKAAKYLVEQNRLLINGDFRVFTDMVNKLTKEKQKDASTTIKIDSVVEEVHAWFEQALVETILGIQQLKGSKEWSTDIIGKALSEEALTTAVMQRYHIHIACRRDLGAKLGKAINAITEESKQ